jgi:hypothetical protein
MVQSMSDIEALLSVDAGKTPPGTVAFFQRDPEAAQRRLYRVLAVLVGGAALVVGACVCSGVMVGLHRLPIALLALAGIGLGLAGLPPERDPLTSRYKRPALVLTATGMIMRDHSGLRSWAFDQLKDVRPYLHHQRIGLLITLQDGSRDFVDTLSFERGDKVRELIGRRLKLREA